MELVLAVLAVLGSLLGGGALVGQWFKLSDHMDKAKRIADQLGLKRAGKDGFVGTFDGVQVTQTSINKGARNPPNWWTITRCTLLEPLPDGLSIAPATGLRQLAGLVGVRDIELGNELDPLLRIGGQRPDDVREVLTDPDVLLRLRAIVHDSGTIELSGESVEAGQPGRHLNDPGARIRRVTDLVRALRAARRKHWQAVADAHGLELDDDATELSGHVGGRSIRVRRVPGRTEITLSADLGLPGGTTVTHREVSDGSVRLGDPILDEMLAVETSDPVTLARFLSDEAVRGPLLEVLHGHRGSTLTEVLVMLHLAGWPGKRLVQAVDSVIELVGALEAAQR